MRVRQSVRCSVVSVDDEDMQELRRRKVIKRQAIEAIEGLKRFLRSEPEPRARGEFERYAIKLELAHQAVLEVVGNAN